MGIKNWLTAMGLVAVTSNANAAVLNDSGKDVEPVKKEVKMEPSQKVEDMGSVAPFAPITGDKEMSNGETYDTSKANEMKQMQTDAVKLKNLRQGVSVAESEIAAENAKNEPVEKLERPVVAADKIWNESWTQVGNVDGANIVGNLFDKNNKQYSTNMEVHRPETVRDETVQLNTLDDYDAVSRLGYFSKEDGKAHMGDFKLSDELKEQINPTDNLDFGVVSGVPMYEHVVLNHENTHYEHDLRGQTPNSIDCSPTMAIERDYVTEQVATAVGFLTLANTWKQCHDAGMEYYQHDGKDIPLNDMLNVYPSLKEEIEKNGFNPQSEESIRNVIGLSVKHFNENYLEIYKESQFADAASVAATSSHIMSQIVTARGHEQAMRDMTKNLDIGYGMRIDFPEDCVDLVMPDKNLAQTVSDAGLTTEGLLAIDKHMDSLGLKNDEARAAYLKEQYTKIVNRAPDADLKLKEVMLDASSNKTISYTDGLMEKQVGSERFISSDKGRTFVLVPFGDKQVDGKMPNTSSGNTFAAIALSRDNNFR